MHAGTVLASCKLQSPLHSIACAMLQMHSSIVKQGLQGCHMDPQFAVGQLYSRRMQTRAVLCRRWLRASQQRLTVRSTSMLLFSEFECVLSHGNS